MTITFNGGFTITNCEAFLEELVSNRHDSSLLLPTHSKKAHIGGEAAVTQAIITWAMTRDKAHLRTYLDNDNQIDDFIRSLHGIIAVFMCDEAQDINKQSIRDKFFSKALERLDVMQGPTPRKAARGLAMQAICVDHINKSTPLVFYDIGLNIEGLRRPSQFKDIILNELIYPAIPTVWRKSFQHTDLSNLGGLLYELIKNTDEHARTDYQGNILKKSIRGLYVSHHSLMPQNLNRYVEGIASLSSYVQRITPPKLKDNIQASNVQFLELSIFDSGPGFAQRFLKKKSILLKEEIEAVNLCFQKNITSTNVDYRGQGLPQVIRILREYKGFLKIRTGRLSLYLDPSANNSKNSLKLLDVSGENEIRELSPAQGTLITVIIPIGQ